MNFSPFISFALACLLPLSCGVTAFAEELTPPETVSAAYAVMDSSTGQILIQKNMDELHYPASITKILTCALSLEAVRPDDLYTFSDEAADYDLTGTHLAFVPGEQVTIADLEYGMMLASANDAAQGLAEAAAGSLPAFVERMNAKAAELGASNSHFTNPSGYHDPELVSTARDMAIITRWALGVSGFRTYFGAWEYTIGPTNIKNESRNLGTYHAMIVGPENNPVFGYKGASGGKLGWTPESTHTIVTVAERDGVELICVAMKSVNQYAKYRDSRALFDYCFDNFAPATLPLAEYSALNIEVDGEGKKVGTLTLSAPQEIQVLLLKGLSADDLKISCPLPETLQLGASQDFSLSVSLSNAVPGMEQEILSLPLSGEFHEDAINNVPVPVAKTKSFDWLPWLIALFSFLLLLAVSVLFIRIYNLRRYKKRRAARLRKRMQP